MASDWAIAKAEAIVAEGLKRGGVHPDVFRRTWLAGEFAQALREAKAEGKKEGRAEGMREAADICDEHQTTDGGYLAIKLRKKSGEGEAANGG